MNYYLVSYQLAVRLGVTAFRHGNSTLGYIVTAGDLAPIGVSEAVSEGAKPCTEAEAVNFINRLKSI